jgi:hypothetical protein
MTVTDNVRKSEPKPELRKSIEESCARQNTVKWKTYAPLDAEFVRGMPSRSTFSTLRCAQDDIKIIQAGRSRA